MQKKVFDPERAKEETADVVHRRFAAIAWVVLIGLAAFVATFAAATQLWDYPFPAKSAVADCLGVSRRLRPYRVRVSRVREHAQA